MEGRLAIGPTVVMWYPFTFKEEKWLRESPMAQSINRLREDFCPSTKSL
jgi:hypothetical protein